MKDQIKWVLNTMPKSDDRQLPIMSLSNVAKARFFHSTFPQYSVTPLDRPACASKTSPSALA